MKELNFIVLMDYYKETLTLKQRRALEYYYESNLSLSETAKLLKITRAGARDLIKRASKTINLLEEQTGFVKKNSRVLKKLYILEKKAPTQAFKKEIRKLIDII